MKKENKIPIVDILKEAFMLYKKRISNNQHWGICSAIVNIIEKEFNFINASINYIPKLNKEFLEVENDKYDPYWWDKEDTKSRIKAFEKLIDYYSLPENKNKFITK